jgi:ATP-binding cassette subfamily B protein
MFLIAIGLLFAQANLDLALPDYLSDIVDTGIQQGGIVNVSPIAMRESQLNKTFVFTSSENKTAILEAYTLVTENSTSYNSSLGTYPLLANQSLYIRKGVNQAKIDQLNGLLRKPIVTVFVLDEALANPENYTEIWTALGIDPTSLPPGVDFYDYLETLSFSNRTLIMEGITASFEAIGGSRA